MAYKHRSKNTELSRELPGAIAGFVVFAFFVAISWVLGVEHILALGYGDILMGLLLAGFSGYAYSALNRKRRYDYTIGIMLVGYLVGAYVVEPLYPAGQFATNLATASTQISFLIWIMLAVFMIVILIAPFVYAKRTRMH